MKIVEMQPGDWESVSRIYGEGIATGNATFEQQVPAFEAWSSAHIRGCSLVARKDVRESGYLDAAGRHRLSPF